MAEMILGTDAGRNAKRIYSAHPGPTNHPNQDRIDYIIKEAGLPSNYSDRKIRLRLALARKLLGIEEEKV